MTEGTTFADLAWLFTCDNRNRGIIRQNFDEAALLWRAVKASGGPILEIGRRHGGTTVLLTTAAAGRRVTSLDIEPAHLPPCEAFFDRVRAADPDCLELLVASSHQPLPGRWFGLLFIDGDHSYEGVRADVLAHWSSLRPVDGRPALAVFHDAVPNGGLDHAGHPNHCEGVQRLCGELLTLGIAERVEAAGSSLLLRKLAELPADWAPPRATPAARRYPHLPRRDDIVTLARPGGIGVELGVCEGVFSEALLKRGVLSYLYSIDMYAGDRGHDIGQFTRAITRLMPFRERNCVLKLRFDEALPLFPDGFFDFIYIDGYAHTGEEDGQTFVDWYPKLKPGGIFAGHDYHADWPRVIDRVDWFVKEMNLDLHVMENLDVTGHPTYPNWFVFKPG